MKPYYQDEYVTIYHGDSMELLPMECGAVITSPPYNMGGFHQMYNGNSAKWSYGEHNDAMPENEYQEWQQDVLELLYEGSNGPLFYSHRNRIVNGEMICPLDWIRQTRWIVHQCVVVNKGSGANVDKRRFFPVHENIWVCFKAANDRINNSDSLTDVWFVGDQQTNRKDIGHPAVMPLSAAAKCIAVTDGVVLDPFAGSGTTGRAAKDLGRKAVLIEREERYCEIAARRMGQGVLDFGTANDQVDAPSGATAERR